MSHINKDERTGEEIYAGIVTRIKIMYQDKITDAQSQEAARNLIGFCQEILNYKLKKQKQRECTGKQNVIDLSRGII